MSIQHHHTINTAMATAGRTQGLRAFIAAAATLLLAACATGIPKDTAFTADAEDAIVVLPNGPGHVLLTSVNPDTASKDGVYEEYVAVSGEQYAVYRVPAGTYIFTSHSFYNDRTQSLAFRCLRLAAPVFEVEAGKVNVAPMVEPNRWNAREPAIDEATWTARSAEALALYPNIAAPVQEAELVAVGRPVAGEGYSCMKDSYETLSRPSAASNG
ncbi:MAG: hypothetical protein AAF830_10235 [Pseudomonadota bacterium]